MAGAAASVIVQDEYSLANTMQVYCRSNEMRVLAYTCVAHEGCVFYLLSITTPRLLQLFILLALSASIFQSAQIQILADGELDNNTSPLSQSPLRVVQFNREPWPAD